jgi:hypothetical protein
VPLCGGERTRLACYASPARTFGARRNELLRPRSPRNRNTIGEASFCLGSAPVSGVGFGVSPKYYFFCLIRRFTDFRRLAAPHNCVTAQTLAEENASPRVLRQLGFVLKGPVTDPEEGTVWEWSDEKATIELVALSSGFTQKRNRVIIRQ